jgi:hypothetical protein
MSEKEEDTNQDSNIKEETSNVELIYTYTAALIKAQEDSLNRLDTKLSAFLAFAGVSLRFVVDLPNKSQLEGIPTTILVTSMVLKILACFFCLVSIVICVLGLTAKMRGAVVDPEILMDDKWYWEEPDRCRAFIINTWIDTSKEFRALGKKKGGTLNWAIRLICTVAITVALDTILLICYR